MNYYYSPHTGEQILTDDPADWMGATSIAPPAHNPTQSAIFANGAWTVVNAKPPEAPVPRGVTMRQARLALLQIGRLADVNAAIAGMLGPEGEAARIEWEYSQEVQRNKALVLALAPALNLTSEQLDQLFVTAATL